MRDLILNAKRGLAVLLSVAALMTGSGISVYAEELSTNENTDCAEVIEVGAADEEIETMGEKADEPEAGASAIAKITGNNSASGYNGEVSDYNGTVSSLDGVKCDTKVMKSAMNNKGWVKVSFKVKGAKYYKLERLSTDGTLETILPQSNKKRSYTDKDACKKSDASYIYVMSAYDKNGVKVGDSYATVPAPMMLQGQTVDDTAYAEIMFMQLKGAVSYKLERSDTNKKNTSYTEIADIKASDLGGKDVRVSSYNGQQFTYVRYKDMGGNFDYGSKHYYRVRAYVDETDVISLYSKALTVRASLPQPEIVNIVGPHAQGGTCYKDGVIQFTPVDADEGDVKYYEIYRSTEKDAKYKKIKKIKAKNLVEKKVSTLNGGEVGAYCVEYTKFPPEVTYYYKVRAIGPKNIKGAFSEWFENTTHFAPVTGVTAETVNQKSLRVSWNSEKCATKYEVWRSGPYMTSPLNGDLTKQFTKIATVSNKPSSKGTVSYKDSKGLQGASYYCYQIVPVNGKKKGAVSTMLAGAKTTVAGPTKVTADGVSPEQINVTWSETYKASAYTIQRSVTTSLDGGVDTPDAVWEDLGTYKSGTTEFKTRTFKDKKVKMGVIYYYRVLSSATMKVKDETGRSYTVTQTSDPEKAVIAKGYARPKAPSSFKITLVTDDGNWTGNKVSWKKLEETNHIKEYVLERKTSVKNEWEEVKRFPETGASSYKHYFYDDDDRGVHYYYRVYAVYDDGTTQIDGRKASDDILMPKKIFINSEAATLKVGQTYKVKVTGFDPKEPTFKDMVFTNSNSAVAKATSSGTENGYAYVTFTAKAKGTTTVTVKPKYYTGDSSNLVKKCKITVQ